MLVIFLNGLAVGSFLNVLIYRLPRGLNVMRGRSFCPGCKKKIAWYDNIPLLSFILLRGKCRKCGKKISWRYPTVELLTASLFLFEGVRATGGIAGLGGLDIINLALNLILYCSLIVIFFSDLETMIIPDEILIPTIILYAAYRLFLLLPITNYYLIFTIFSPALFSFSFLLIIFLLTRGRGMGFGDVKLAFLMGLMLGYPAVIAAFYLSFLTGAFIGTILLLYKKVELKSRIAFGPFLAGSTFLVYFFNSQIVSFIYRFLGISG